MSDVDAEERKFPLTVSLAAMSNQTRAQIEYYIERSNKRCFSTASSANSADVIIVDYDHPGTAGQLLAGDWQTDATLVVLAAGNPIIEGAILVDKPLESVALENAAAIALQQLNGYFAPVGQMRDTGEVGDVSSGNDASIIEEQERVFPKLTVRADPSRPDDADTPAYFRTIDAALPGPRTLSIPTRIRRYEDKIALLCGESRTLEQLSDAYDTDHRYDPTHCLSQRVAQIVFNSDPDIKAVHIKLPEAEIYVLPTLNKVYTSISLEYKRNVKRLFRDWNNVDIKMFEYDNNNVNEVIDTLNQSTRYSFSCQSFCWLSSLFSAQGRLPLGLNIDAPWKLLHWPNITRLELIPDSLEISAAWTDNVVTLPQIIDRVGCEPRHAVSFLNAASSINLLVGANQFTDHSAEDHER